MSQTMSLEREEVALAGWARGVRRSALQDLLVEGTRPGVLSLALGLPAAELFPAEEYGRAAAEVLARDPRALQYGPPFEPLKKQVVALMRERGVECTEAQVFLTAGAQQGANMLARLLLDQGAQVVVEEMTYPGFQQVLQPYCPEVLTVPTDAETGMDVDALERLLEGGARPALIYCVTDGHNPLAVSLSRDKRERLVSLARAFRVPVVEDDPYGFLQYGGAAAAPLRALDDRWVLYVGTFSKILAPALRAGWVVVPEHLVPLLSIVKESSDINMAPLSQRAVSAFIDAGHLGGHVATLRREYGRRRDAMHEALAEHFGGLARWHRPSSGMFFWVELPEEVDTTRLFRRAIDAERVAFLPGPAFGVGRERATNCMRLNFSHNPPGLIREGVERIARVLKGGLS